MAFTKKLEPAAQPVAQDLMAQPFRTERQAFQVAAAAPATVEDQVLESVIGNDLSIEGQSITIRCKGSLKVLGNIQADLHSKRLEVGKEAIINGAIAADTIDVFGRVQGAILGTRVVLHSGADVEGDIFSMVLSVEHGANFDGRSKRVTDSATIAPQLERPSAATASALLATPQHSSQDGTGYGRSMPSPDSIAASLAN